MESEKKNVSSAGTFQNASENPNAPPVVVQHGHHHRPIKSPFLLLLQLFPDSQGNFYFEEDGQRIFRQKTTPNGRFDLNSLIQKNGIMNSLQC